MTRFEAIQEMKKSKSDIIYRINCNRRLAGVWNDKKRRFQKTGEYLEYKENCSSVLQNMLDLLRYLSTENLYPNSDKSNKFKICYTIYWLKIKIKELKEIMRKNRINEKKLYEVSPTALKEKLQDLLVVKRCLFNETDSMLMCFKPNYQQIVMEERINTLLQLVLESKKLLPIYMEEKVNKLCFGIIALKSYLCEEVKDYGAVIEDYTKISSLVKNISHAVAELNQEKETLRIRCIISASIVESIYNSYNHIAETLEDTVIKIKGGNVQWNKILED